MFYYLFRGQEVRGEPPTYKKTFNMLQENFMFKRFFSQLCAAVGNDIARVEKW